MSTILVYTSVYDLAPIKAIQCLPTLWQT